MSEIKVNGSISRVNYQGIIDVIAKMEEIGNDNVAIGKKFEDTINSFKNDKILSSKVITPTMEEMISSINSLNNKFKENIDKYCDFLRKEVNLGYANTDENVEDIWNNLKSIYDSAKG